ncbi:MAG TPA: ABC transporter ATP-binding protein [Planctomycetota bacterium]|nr:ABC transporter ATP-binding protein [Planctomycetota bacterium]
MTSSQEGTIRVDGLTRSFKTKVALHPTSFEIGRGGVTALLGPNGSGKSTLLRSMVGLVRPDAGTVSIDGVRLEGDGTAVRRRCTFAPGEINLYKEMRGEEHLRWLLRGREAEAASRALQLAEALELPLRARVRTYSHGMKRPLLFAFAMAPRVAVRILDEPSEGLDPSKRGAILELIERDAASGTTILLSSHHLGEVDKSSTRMLFLHAGRLVKSEDSQAVRARAARTLRLEYPSLLADPARAKALSATLVELGAASVAVRGTRTIVQLASEDPRPFLAALCASAALPPPESIEHGHLSLGELYQDVYGVEAV